MIELRAGLLVPSACLHCGRTASGCICAVPEPRAPRHGLVESPAFFAGGAWSGGLQA